MTDVAAPILPSLVTIRNVELFRAGEEWPLSSGPVTFTLDHIVSSVNAIDDPEVRSPVLKLGHEGPMTSDQPALGKIMNMRADLTTLAAIGDLVGVPIWLARSLPYVYPSRSIEGNLHHKTPQGEKEHLMILTGLALLGSDWPGITNIPDLEEAITATVIPDFILPFMPEGAIAADAAERRRLHG